LIPMIVIAMFVTFPAACRRVQLPVWKVAWKAVWPAVWPAIVMAIFILFWSAKLENKNSWSALILQSFIGGAIYVSLFFIAMDRNELNWYFKKLKEVFRRDSATSASTDLGIPS